MWLKVMDLVSIWLQLDNVLLKHVTAQGSSNYLTYAKVGGAHADQLVAGIVHFLVQGILTQLIRRVRVCECICPELLSVPVSPNLRHLATFA
jgi:hypothetical protein